MRLAARIADMRRIVIAAAGGILSTLSLPATALAAPSHHSQIDVAHPVSSYASQALCRPLPAELQVFLGVSIYQQCPGLLRHRVR